MRNIIFAILIICLVLSTLCACGKTKPSTNQKSEVIEILTDEDKKSGEELTYDDFLDDYISRSNYNATLKIGDENPSEIDMNYAKEYYKVLRQYKDNYDSMCATVDDPEKDFPVLVIRSDDSIKAYEYVDGTVKAIDASQYDLKDDDYVYIFDGINTFENTIIEQGNLCNYLEGVKINNRTKEEILHDYVTVYDNIYLGSDYNSVELEDGTVIEQNTIISMDDDGKLFMTLVDTGMNVEKKLAINGIDEKIVLGACYSANEQEPILIYELSENGNVYCIDTKEISIINAEQNSVDAKKIVSSENVISLEPLYTYPCRIYKHGENGLYYYGLTIDGTLISLAK